MSLKQVVKNHLFFAGSVVAFFGCMSFFASLLLPVFQGPDEPVHYATIQKWAHPKQVASPVQEGVDPPQPNQNDIRTFRFPAEVTQAALLTRFDEVKWQSENTLHFTSSSLWGVDEQTFVAAHHERVITALPSGTSGTWSWHYWLGSKIESALGQEDFFTRFFVMRFLSVLLGLGVAICAWYAFSSLGFAQREAWLVALIATSQPMLVATAAIVNIDIALIFSFSLFFLGSVRLIYHGFSWHWTILTIVAAILGIAAKGPGIVLILTLVLLPCFTHSWTSIRACLFKKETFLIAGVLIGLGWIAIPPAYLTDITRFNQTSAFASPLVSVGHYLEKSLDPNTLSWSHTSYWGNFGWLDTPLPDLILELIIAAELVALFGLFGYLWAKDQPDYLPTKKVVLWSLFLVLSLQLAIRFFDWRVFDATGKLLIGTPGRYFLPTVLPYTLLIITGLGWFTANRKQFFALLKALALLSLLLLSISLWYVVLPRFYL